MSRRWWTMLCAAAAAHIGLTWLLALRRGHLARSSPAAPAPARPISWPSVSVLIPAWNERGTIEGCLEALGEISYPDWEVIVIAGGSDGSLAAAQEAAAGLFGAQVIEQQPGGKNAALNWGLAHAYGDVIVLLDADSRPEPSWLHEMVAALSDETPVVTGSYRPLKRSAISLEEQMELIALREIRQIHSLQGSGGIALRRAIVERLGSFPEQVRVGVDWDLDIRLAQLGVGRGLAARALLKTERPATVGEFWHNELRWRRAHLRALIRQRRQLMPTPGAAVAQLYLYGLAWLAVGGSSGLALAWPSLQPQQRTSALRLWGLGAAWLLLRRAALAAEVAAHQRSWAWLGLAWAPPMTLCMTLPAAVLATVDLLREEPQTFQGPRPGKGAAHAR
jgi:cellulose synthase/poly-beta-1,6-N-acetylglucosamine synthase-like glycosyltransferase